MESVRYAAARITPRITLAGMARARGPFGAICSFICVNTQMCLSIIQESYCGSDELGGCWREGY
jgi:hypothetical protein